MLIIVAMLVVSTIVFSKSARADSLTLDNFSSIKADLESNVLSDGECIYEYTFAIVCASKAGGKTSELFLFDPDKSLARKAITFGGLNGKNAVWISSEKKWSFLDLSDQPITTGYPTQTTNGDNAGVSVKINTGGLFVCDAGTTRRKEDCYVAHKLYIDPNNSNPANAKFTVASADPGNVLPGLLDSTKTDPCSDTGPDGIIGFVGGIFDGSTASGLVDKFLCELTNTINQTISSLVGTNTGDGLLIDLLTVKPLEQADAVFAGWSVVRNLALGLYTIVFLVFIFGNSLGMSNYTIKRSMPRLVFGALLTSASFYIVKFLVDFSNLLGVAVPNLIQSFAPNADIANIGTTLSGGGGGFANAFAGAGLIILILIMSVVALVAVFVAIIVFMMRYLVIYLLILSAPLAFLAWVLPNTESLFKKWWSSFGRVLLMFPIATGMIAISLFVSTLINPPPPPPPAPQVQTGSILVKVAGALAPIFALIMLPKSYKWGGEAFSKVGAFAAGYATNAVTKSRDVGKSGIGAAKSGAQNRILQSDNKAFGGNSRMGGFMAGAGVGSLANTRGAQLRRAGKVVKLQGEIEKASSLQYDQTMASAGATARAKNLDEGDAKTAAFQRLISNAPKQERAQYARKAVQSGNRGQVQMAAAAMGQQGYEEFVNNNYGDFDAMSDMRKFGAASTPPGSATRNAAVQSALAAMGSKGLTAGNAETQKEWFGSYDAATRVPTPKADNIRAIDTSTLGNALGDRSNRNNLTPDTIKALRAFAYDPANTGDLHAESIKKHLDSKGEWITT